MKLPSYYNRFPCLHNIVFSEFLIVNYIKFIVNFKNLCYNVTEDTILQPVNFFNISGGLYEKYRTED